MVIYLYIAMGGALGALARFGVVQQSARFFATSFPVGTLLVNIVGSFLMGLVAFYVLSRSGFTGTRALVMTGFLGGFTTFSAFSLDVLQQIEKGEIWQAIIYSIASVVLSVLAVFVGYWLMRSLSA